MLGKKFLLTGGTGGLGEAILEELIRNGAFVTVIGRNEEKLAGLTAKYPAQVDVFKADLNEREAVDRLGDFLRSGQTVYDGLINNAGFGYFKSFMDHTPEEIHDVLNVNLTQTILLTHLVIPYIRAEGSIVNISSQAARVTTPYSSIYAASKAGLSAFTNALRMEEPLHVMTVQTGPIGTAFFTRADSSGKYDAMTKRLQLDRHKLAREIVDGIVTKKTEINRPQWMHYGLTLYNLFPRFIERKLERPFLSKSRLD
ncbi:SDR family NAD(P)-dependent oxidoreductase [Macrococcus equipercicus]|uniref:SDR family NAD(P)-dependent oxidoreductase n=1 Tax=Macrococcus equipercicus TaxID=69967 RepID=A0A9Q9F0F4_9STAP|nr:SDR family NAD(P)-dependent oxidoreductase [Macrococcus equipercicus]UTH12898.1 SDR family NAD(P)-dependent oxidoreductase [Macrococcus equipercicus]